MRPDPKTNRGNPLASIPRVAWVTLAAVTLLAAWGCDNHADVTLTSNITGQSTMRDDVVRLFVPTESVSSIYRNRSPGGLNIDAPPRANTIDDTSVSIGPISTVSGFDAWSVSADNSVWSVEFELQQTNLTLPVRVDQRSGVRICRFRAESDRLGIETTLEVFSSDSSNLEADGAMPPTPGDIVSASAPTVSPESLRFQVIGECPPLVDSPASVQQGSELYAALENYLRDATIQSTERLLQLSPVNALGLIEGTAQLRRQSLFESRLGELSYSALARGNISVPEDNPGVTLESSGVYIDMAASVRSLRAPCFPPDPAPSVSHEPAERPTPQDISGTDTDIVSSFSSSVIARVLQGAALGGFYCLGLEPQSGVRSPIPRVTSSEVRLEDVGLGHLPVTGDLDLVISPGAFPNLSFEPNEDTVQASWSDLTIGLYGRIDETRVRIARVTIDAEFGLRPFLPDESGRRSDRSIPFRLESLRVENVSFSSDWRSEESPPGEIDRWARRLTNLAFDPALTLPLPFEPMATGTLTSATLRQHDLLVGWNLDAPD